MKIPCHKCHNRGYFFKIICYPYDNVYELFPVICDKCKNGYISFWQWIKGRFGEKERKGKKGRG
jgi:hypothetical protein